MNIKIKEALGNSSFRNTLIVAFGTLIGSFFSYLSQLLLGRTLTVADYGTFTALLSFSSILGVPSLVFGISIVKRVAEYTANGSKAMTSKMFRSLSFWTLILGFFIFTALYFYSTSLAEKLNIKENNVMYAFAFYTGLSFFSIIPVSFMQGLMYFKRWAFFTAFTGFIRMLFSYLPALLGFGVAGVFFGFSIYVIIGYLVALTLLLKIFTKEKAGDVLPEYKKIMTFGTATLFVYLCLTALNNIDVVMVKRYFDSEAVGFYAGAVTVGKIFLYGSIAVASLMFPTISALYARKENFKPKLKQLFFIQLLFIFAGLFIFEVFPSQITTLFFGQAFLNSVPYLRIYSLFIACFILVNFLVTFLLAIEKTKAYLFLLPGSLLQYVLISARHESIFQVVYAGVFSSLLMAVALFIYLYFILRKVKYN